jgi:hypothetical protein
VPGVQVAADPVRVETIRRVERDLDLEEARLRR